MRLPSNTIQKLMRENFSQANPIRILPHERSAWEKKLNQHLIGQPNIKLNKTRYIPEQLLCQFSIVDPAGEDSYRDETDFWLMRDERGYLFIEPRYGSGRATISSLDELDDFIDTCRERLERKHLQKSKSAKVRTLKAQAIEAQVKKLAKEEKFDFKTSSDSVKIFLDVKLSEKEHVELQIPFHKFQEVLPELRLIIQSARELYTRGIKFKVQKNDRWNSWISHESL